MPYPPYDTSGVINSVGDFVNLWISVANSLKTYPNVFFELYNEPNGDAASWFGATQQCITAIRATGATNLVVVQFNYCVGIDFVYYNSGSKWGMDWVNQYPLTDPLNNIVYSTHIYRTSFYSDSNSNDGYAYSTSDMTWALTQLSVIGFNKPLWIGEIGCNLWASNMNNEYAWFANTLAILNQNGIGYCAWAWAPWVTGTEWALVDGNSNYNLNQAGQTLEQQIQAAPQPSSTPSPTPTATATPTPTPTVTPTPIVTPTPVTTPTPTQTPTPTATPSPTPDPTATPQPTTLPQQPPHQLQLK